MRPFILASQFKILNAMYLGRIVRPLSIDVPGELYIGGDGVTKGYLNREDLTSERFIDTQHGRLYRTGDQVKWRPSGVLEYLQRIDNQVKVRGFRIELGEIESALVSFSAIRECVAVVKDFGNSDRRIVAYVCMESGRQMTNTELRKHLRTTLPDYMVPQLFIELESLPLTPNGKIDRKALPDPLQSLNQEKHVIAPRNPIEESIARIWKQAIKLEELSVDDHFFDIGGHSLLALEVIYQIESELGVRVSPLDMLLHSLEHIAEMIAAKNGDLLEELGESESVATDHQDSVAVSDRVEKRDSLTKRFIRKLKG